MFKSYKYLLKPTAEQTKILTQWEGHSRWLWNYFLDLEQKEYAANKKFIWRFELINLIPDLKKKNEWLKEIPSQSLQQIGTSMDLALKGLKSGKGFPKFKKKNVRNGQILIPNQLANGKDYSIKITPSHITMPKIGAVKWKRHRPMSDGRIKSVSITKDIDKWFVSVLVEIDDIIPISVDPSTAISIGIDLGIKHFIVDSTGNKIDSPKFLQQKAKRLKRYQRQVSRKQKGSKNRNKARIKLARIHRDVRNTRANWLHKLSTKIVNENDIVCVEDLKTKDLLMRKQQKSLNRQISDQGWGMFLNMLRYKCEHKGKTFTQIDQYAPSSKTCSACGYKVLKMELSTRDWKCSQCGSEHDRDVNAALNILWWGLMATPNTAGTAEINACGVSNSLVNKRHMTLFNKDTLNQETYRSLVYK
jgi:putative transposase